MYDHKEQFELYHQEQDKIFEQFLDDHFFKWWRDTEWCKEDHRMAPSIELILFDKCNYKCKYCYIVRHGNELYPPIPDEEPGDIIENLKSILNWIIDEGFTIPTLDLFSAEFFAQSRWAEVLDTIYFTLTTKRKFCSGVTIPTNMSFVMNDELVKKVEEYLAKFEEIGCPIHLSGSVDGLHCDNLSRPGATKYNELFYTKLFEFARDNSVGFHPMISPENIEAWKDNIDWWIDMYEKYNICPVTKYRLGYLRRHPEIEQVERVGAPFLLEVRNDEWNETKLKAYEDFLHHWMDVLINRVFKGDMEWLGISLFKIHNDVINDHIQNTMLAILPEARLTCSIQRQLFIRTRYMDIVPCHRTCYDKFEYGKFKYDENKKITGLKANNIPLMMKILEMNPMYSMPKCCSCELSPICMGQCLGAMYEFCGDLFVPADGVCELFKIKYNTIFDLYKKHNLFCITDGIRRKIDEIDIADLGKRTCGNVDEVREREELICRVLRRK